MAYLIDGHNLIPKVPGLSLDAIDDEMQLVELLVEFCRLQRKVIEVFFDKAPAGQANSRKFGAVTAHFIRQGTTADDAILRRLNGLGRQASNWTVVSSDAAVQGSGRRAHAHVISSDAFSKQLVKALGSAGRKPSSPEDKPLSPSEMDDWLRLFGEKD
jgi:uncharacterized protein